MSRKNTKIEIAKNSAVSPIYHEDDKEGLRRFLEQPSIEYGEANAKQLGVSALDWQNSEEWVAEIPNLTWNNESPKRLIKIDWSRKCLAGTLDASQWKKLIYLDCSRNYLFALDVSTNTKLKDLHCSYNRLVAMDVKANKKLIVFDCSCNDLAVLDLRTNTKLTHLHCSQNLLTSIEVGANMKFTEFFLEPICKVPEEFC
ncbi:MAG: hypothetical protein FWD09_04820 [Lentimicrobiaceae bacterium]|nr:hypothetical protein [Lentimicrobiaceae bacterium]